MAGVSLGVISVVLLSFDVLEEIVTVFPFLNFSSFRVFAEGWLGTASSVVFVVVGLVLNLCREIV